MLGGFYYCKKENIYETASWFAWDFVFNDGTCTYDRHTYILERILHLPIIKIKKKPQ